MEACYVVFHGEAVVVNAKEQTRREIESIINELKAQSEKPVENILSFAKKCVPLPHET